MQEKQYTTEEKIKLINGYRKLVYRRNPYSPLETIVPSVKPLFLASYKLWIIHREDFKETDIITNFCSDKCRKAYIEDLSRLMGSTPEEALEKWIQFYNENSNAPMPSFGEIELKLAIVGER